MNTSVELPVEAVQPLTDKKLIVKGNAASAWNVHPCRGLLNLKGVLQHLVTVTRLGTKDGL